MIKPLVLLVDDDTTQLALFAMMLKHSPYEVITASTAEEALSYCYEQKPDIAVVDFALPSITGMELIHTLQQDGAFTNLKAILITARPILERTDIKVLQKPFNRNTFTSLLQEVLSAAD